MSDTDNSRRMPSAPSPPEPWLRGTLQEVLAVPRAVLHALELADEDLKQWCADLTTDELNARPAGLPSVAFQLQHIARSIDRLLTYAENWALNDTQMDALRSEHQPAGNVHQLFAELKLSFDSAAKRILILERADLEAARSVGRKALPTTLCGLLVHIADHTQRHVGQVITTCKVIAARRS